ncbi:hypothetical protein ABK040_015711 [Willaertia magna]
MTQHQVESPPKSYKNFTYVDHLSFHSLGTIYKYKSDHTGLHVSLVQIESPIIKGYLTVRTRASDDDGIPHVLEHLIFMGSEDYPYKGMLDKLANRCFAQGTNAYTSTINTTYELSTAGKEGFFRLLPVYLDAILFPTLTPSSFHTEIHHINNKGEDSGVVYNEMLGRENQVDELLHNAFMEVMYEGAEGYQYNTGGKVENLRSLTLDKVKKFHSEYYVPNNLNVIIVGHLKIEELIDELTDAIETKILKKQEQQAFKTVENIWRQPVPPLKSSVKKEIVYPSDEEESGHYVVIGWRLCEWDDFLTTYAVATLWSYFTSGDIAPLRLEFVENPSGETYCGDVAFSVDKARENAHRVLFVNVEVDKLEQIYDKFFEFIKNHKLDLDYMKLVIHRDKLEGLKQFETSPHETFSGEVIEDFLFSTKNQDLHEMLNFEHFSNILSEKDENYWNELINTHILNKKNVTLIAVPSSERAKQIAQDEAERVTVQAEKLGNEKLLQLGKELEEAESYNSRPIDPKLIEKFPIPSLSKIDPIKVATFRNDHYSRVNRKSELDNQLTEKLQPVPELPFFLQVTSIPTQFVDMHCYMDSSDVPHALKMYAPLFLAINFSCDMKIGDNYIPKEQVIISLMKESISTDFGCGFSNSDSDESRNFHAGLFAELFSFHLSFEIAHYSKLVEWTKNFLYHTEYTPEIIETKIQVLLSEIQMYKISPESLCADGLKRLCISEQSNNSCLSYLVQESFLVQTLMTLKTNPDKVINDLKELRNLLNRPENLRIHLVLDAEQINPTNQVVSAWKNLTSSEKPINALSKVCTWTNELLLEKNRGVILGIGSTDSGYLLRSCKGITDYENHQDRHALNVAINFITGEEGPFWVGLRGKGLCYSFSIISNVEKGLLLFVLYRAANVQQTYTEAKNIVEILCKEDQSDLPHHLVMDEQSIQSAKATYVFEKLQHAETFSAIAQTRFLTETLFNGSQEYYESIQEIQQVTISDVKRVLKQYILPLFDQETSSMFICDNSEKVNQYDVSVFCSNKEGYLSTYTSLKDYMKEELGVESNDMSIGEDGDEEEEGEEEEQEEIEE